MINDLLVGDGDLCISILATSSEMVMRIPSILECMPRGLLLCIHASILVLKTIERETKSIAGGHVVTALTTSH